MKRLMAAMLLFVIFTGSAAADTDAWILCKPDSFVYARRSPTKNALELGRLELGDKVILTGNEKNGFSECYGLTFEQSGGWIFSGYLVNDKPEPDGGTYIASGNGRTAIRRWVNGPRRAWAKHGATFKVYAKSSEWALTSRGFIRTEYIDPEGEE